MTHGLTVKSKASYGHVDGVWAQTGTEWSAELPHSCDEWVFGTGDQGAVLLALEQLRMEVEGAIAFLKEAPQWPIKAYEGDWKGLGKEAAGGSEVKAP